MFCFSWIFLATLTFINANPIPNDDSNDSNDSNLNPNTIDFNFNDDVDKNVASLPLASNEFIIANSKNAIDTKCNSDAMIDDIHHDIGDNLQKRFKTCPTEVIPKAPAQLSPQKPAKEPKESTTTSPDLCAGSVALPHFVSCGGPEFINPDGDSLLPAVLNCVRCLFFHLAAHFYM